jgi:VIT1/CCC1 family predicted Fe2+/Mn2+ transporter
MDELNHYNTWKKYTGKETGPRKLSVLKYFLISKILGLNFGLKLMERGEKNAQSNYEILKKEAPEAKKIIKEEEGHEKKIIEFLNEDKLKYASSAVLGINDAIVEITGALAGITFALRDAKIIAMTGVITGIAASLSMAASEYLSKRSEGVKNPFKPAFYTGGGYFLTIIFLILPFLFLQDVYLSIALTLISAVIIIFLFTYYISTAKEYSFKKRFFEMFLISMGVAAVSFGIGLLVRIIFGVGA